MAVGTRSPVRSFQRAKLLLSWGFPGGQVVVFSLLDLAFARQQPPPSWPMPGRAPSCREASPFSLSRGGPRSLLEALKKASVTKCVCCFPKGKLLSGDQSSSALPAAGVPWASSEMPCLKKKQEDALFREHVGHVR